MDIYKSKSSGKLYRLKRRGKSVNVFIECDSEGNDIMKKADHSGKIEKVTAIFLGFSKLEKVK